MVLRVLEWLLRALRGRHNGPAGDAPAGGGDALKEDALASDDGLPFTCLRGLRKQDWVTPEGIVASPAFVPDKKKTGEAARADGGKEVSVNWEDNDQVLPLTFKGHGQHGAARLNRRAVGAVNQKAPPPVAILCERRLADDQPDNPHHRNLVFRDGLSPPLEKGSHTVTTSTS